jgi:hypothetical protein
MWRGETEIPMSAVPQSAPPTRDCGECTLCCKLLGIESLDKPAGVWCAHCKPSRGCGIYESRPQDCRNFICGYLLMPEVDERWKPSVCKFVLANGQDNTHMKIVVDPARPDAWKKEPYYSRFKQWARSGPEQAMKIMVAIGKRAIVILPDHDVDLGIVDDDDRIVTVREITPLGYRFDALKVHKDDPRAREAEAEDSTPAAA